MTISHRSLITVVLCISIYGQPIAGQQLNPFQYSMPKDTSISHGAVASANPLASEVGLEILKKGGNAVDAAIAIQLALAVVYPEAGNIGGGGFTVIHLNDGKNISIDYREEAPGKASRDMYLDKLGQADPHLSQDGHLASGVPGTVAGLFAAHRFGKLPFKDLIEPAIRLAEYGFAITPSEARSLNETQSEFRKLNTVMPVFVRDRPWKAGDTLIQKDLAHTLELIRDKGAPGFYEGETATKIIAEMKRGDGLISAADLAHYTAKLREPQIFPYKDYTIMAMPLPNSGGIMLQQMLGMLSDYPIGDMGFETTRSVQLMTEIERRSYADRAQFMGDPDFVKVPISTLVSTPYLRQRMADYSPTKATPSQDIKAGNIAKESEETTQVSVLDASGNAASVTYTLNGSYGSRVVVGGAGFFLNNEMDDFSAKPGSPNMFGLVGAEANAIAPHKRMLSSMTPTIVLKQGHPYLVVGTPGGSTIITSVFQSLVDVLDFHLTLSETVNAPKFHEQWIPDLVYIEKGFPEKVRTEMEKMGYKFESRSEIGRTEAIESLPNGMIEVVADHRGDDTALGY